MHHKLPAVHDMIQSGFTVIDKTSINDSSLWNRHCFTDTVIFLQGEEGLFYLHPSWISTKADLSFPSLPWLESTRVHRDQPMTEIIPLLLQYEFVLVHDDTEKEIGYLHGMDFFRQLYQSYRYLEAYFETVIQTMDASVTVIDEHERVVVWTKGAEEIFSVKHEEIFGSPITNFFDPGMLEILETLKDGKSLYRHQHRPRSDLFVLINTKPIRLNGEIIGAVASETDITSQVRLNQELFNASSKMHHLEREVAKLKPSPDPFDAIKGTSPAIQKAKERVEKIGSTGATVLITGESGVGKELFAKAVHDVRESPTSPFIPINCGAIPPSLFESELFGYEKGAFSGADQKGKKGKIELAQGGTLFLDEIGEMPYDMQVKLLRVLQEKKYFRVGGTRQIDADFRVVAATNKHLESLVKEGKFREDLYYRLNVITLRIPPLRERREDIIMLIHYFLNEFSLRHNRPLYGISPHIMQELIQYEWPGNIRELRNVIERLVIFATDGNIKREDLPFTSLPHESEEPSVFLSESSMTLREELERHERKVILNTLKQEKGNKQSSAKKLGISRATLYNRIRKLGLPTS
ncbi:sigma-54 interaction domain-containing protein [Salinithrix halophila]|uniref:Sigma-54 interaction domain-containing protein n=1 Tax=Salinithrix halophila TaxID=1485204 RepID=A0ABV8JJE4_9BACL